MKKNNEKLATEESENTGISEQRATLCIGLIIIENISG